MATRLGFHYELDSGSVLGAVKMRDFIPWDIDGDVYLPTIVIREKWRQLTEGFENAGIRGN